MSRDLRSLFSPVLAMVLAGCGGSRATPPAAVNGPAPSAAKAGEPAPHDVDVDALGRRELPPLVKKDFTFGKVAAQVETSGEPKVELSHESAKLTIPIGAEAPLECYVYPDEIDAGGVLAAILKAASTSVELKLVRATDVAVVAEQPALFVAATYLAKGTSGPAVGQLKAMVYAHPVTPLLCMHDEIGYTQTFQRIAEGLAGSLKVSGESPKTYRFVEIEVQRVGADVVGFSSWTVEAAENGATRSREVETLLRPKSRAEVSFEDGASIEIWDKAGKILEASYAKAEGGEISSLIGIKRIGDKEYSYKGKRAGTDVSGKFRTKDKRGLVTKKILAGLVRDRLLSGKASEVKVEEYIASVNPAAPMEVTYRIESKQDKKIRLSVGPLQGIGTADEEGVFRRMELALEGAKFATERVYVRGKL